MKRIIKLFGLGSILLIVGCTTKFGATENLPHIVSYETLLFDTPSGWIEEGQWAENEFMETAIVPTTTIEIVEIFDEDLMATTTETFTHTDYIEGKREARVSQDDIILIRLAGDENFRKVPKDYDTDRKSTRLNSSHSQQSRMPSSA